MFIFIIYVDLKKLKMKCKKKILYPRFLIKRSNDKVVVSQSFEVKPDVQF